MDNESTNTVKSRIFPRRGGINFRPFERHMIRADMESAPTNVLKAGVSSRTPAVFKFFYRYTL